LGFVNDKNLDNLLPLFPKQATYYFCKPNIPRGLDLKVLKKHIKKTSLKGFYFTSVNQAYIAALEQAYKNDLIFIGGSTFVVAEVL